MGIRLLTTCDLVGALDQVVHELGDFELPGTLLSLVFLPQSVAVRDVHLEEVLVDGIHNLQGSQMASKALTLNRYSRLSGRLGLGSGK